MNIYDDYWHSLEIIDECGGVRPEKLYWLNTLYEKRKVLEEQLTKLEQKILPLERIVGKQIINEARRVGKVIYFLGDSETVFYNDDGDTSDITYTYADGNWSYDRKELFALREKLYPTNGDKELKRQRPNIMQSVILTGHEDEFFKALAYYVEETYYREEKGTINTYQLFVMQLSCPDEIRDKVVAYFGKEQIDKYVTIRRAQEEANKIVRDPEDCRKVLSNEKLTKAQKEKLHELSTIIHNCYITKGDFERIRNTTIKFSIKKPRCWSHWIESRIVATMEIRDPYQNWELTIVNL
ncbi:MAG: hypothetical protein J6Y02_20195 [Pseudobutyrivibrio sp.]|nr:hypothetical protein [Pseudobutyrivibrio sp.]